MFINDNIAQQAKKLLDISSAHRITISCAESCTAGLISACLTHHAGSSQVVMAGFVTYANHAKTHMLNVDGNIINSFGAVSSQCCSAMVNGVLEHKLSNFAIAVTGVAGPGASDKKPQGLVYIGCQYKSNIVNKNYISDIKEYHFKGNREDVRLQTVTQALKQSLDYIRNHIIK